MGPATFTRLINEHGTADAALAELPNVAKAAGVKGYEAFSKAAADVEWDTAHALGFQPLFLGGPDYPKHLAETPDAPPFVWVLGDVTHFLKPCIAIVGARNASSMGRRMAASLARDLGDLGYTIVSGLARGVDTAAHTAAIDTGTIAVQAGGLDVIYPKENDALARQIGECGLCISEQPIGLIPQARHFPQRNRIIAGLSLGVIVVEGAARSGSLITAKCAADLGRDVLAVPGNPLDGRAAGCNMLIRDGAVLVRSASDVVECFDTQGAQPKLPLSEAATPKLSLSGAEINQKIFTLLSGAEIEEDDVIRDSGLPAPVVARCLTDLELQGRIIRAPGGKLALAS